MPSLLRMPGVSADADEATIVEWTVSNGSSVTTGDIVAVVETEKATVDIEADRDAVVHSTLVEAGASVAVGHPIAILLTKDEIVSDVSAMLATLGLGDTAAAPATNKPTKSAAAMTSTDQEQAKPVAVPAASASTRLFATPIARRIAREHGLAIDRLVGTGPGGRIQRADVEYSLNNSTPAPAGATSAIVPTTAAAVVEMPHTALRRAIAARLTMSKREAPHFYLTATCRVDRLLELREQLNQGNAQRISINDLMVAAAARAFRVVPEMNVTWTADALLQLPTIDMAVAIASERGLITPVVREADTLSVGRLSAHIRELAALADGGRLKQHQLEGGSLTVTNLGMFGVESFSAIINPPQVGILAIGAVVERPVVEHGALVPGRTVTVTLSVDHRPVDGTLAARWLAEFVRLTESPTQILR